MNQFNSSLALDNNSHESAIQLQVPKWAVTIFWITMATSIQSMTTCNNGLLKHIKRHRTNLLVRIFPRIMFYLCKVQNQLCKIKAKYDFFVFMSKET